MAYIRQNRGVVGSSGNTQALKYFSYFSDTDTLADIMSSNYFVADIKDYSLNSIIIVKSTDETTLIYVNGNDGSTITTTFFLDTAGPLHYKGTWNASTNTPTLVSGVGTEGGFYIVSVAGTTNLDGITDWEIGDWAVFNGSVWTIIENTQLPYFTQYAVPFGNATGSLAEDPANFSFDDSKDQLAIGAPNTTVVINAETRNGSLLAVSNGVPEKWGAISQAFGTSTNAVLLMTRARASQAAPQPSNSGDIIGSLCSGGYDGTDYGLCSEINTVASANHANDNTPADMEFRITPVGAAVPVTAVTLKSDKSLLVDKSISINTETTTLDLNASPVAINYLTENEGATAVVDFVGIQHGLSETVALFGAKSDGTKAAPTIPADTSTMIQIGGLGWDGSTFRPGALIQMQVDGTAGASDMPGKIILLTTPDGSTTPAVRMTIRENGDVEIGASFNLTDDKLLIGNAVDAADKSIVLESVQSSALVAHANNDATGTEHPYYFLRQGTGGSAAALSLNNNNALLISSGSTTDILFNYNATISNAAIGDVPTLTGGTTAFFVNGTTGNITYNNPILVDTINEKTTDAGVTIEGVLIKDSDIDVDVIRGVGAADINLGSKLNASAQDIIDVNNIETDALDGVSNGDIAAMTGGGSMNFSGPIDLQTEQMRNMRFVTTGGTAATLDYYETGSHATDWTGPWAADQTAAIKFTRIGDKVVLDLPNVSSTSTIATIISTTVALPTRLRPSPNIDFIIQVFDTTVKVSKVRITTTGILQITASVTGTGFGSSGTVGIEHTAVSYKI